MTDSIGRRGAALAVVLASLTSGQAIAQQSAPSDVIVVTAEKRATRLVDVPSTVNLVDGSTLESARIDNLDTLTTIVPGLEYTASGGGQLSYPSLRGISPQAFGDPTVTVFQDGIALASSIKGGSANFFDLDRIEVLKGPQSTLYGANSLGGAITLNSRLPNLQAFDGYVRAGFGDYASREYQGAASVPIVTDKFGLRVAGQYTERDGYWDNIFGGRKNVGGVENTGLRAIALFTPSSSFRSVFSYAYSKTEDDCGDCVNGIQGFSLLNPGASTTGKLDGDRLNEFHNQNVIGSFQREINRATWENRLDLGSMALTSLTGYAEMTNNSLQDFDRLPSDTFFIDADAKEDFNVFSQEVRLQSTGEGALRWLVGAYYAKSETDLTATAGIGLPFRPTLLSQEDEFENYALFTQNTWVVNDKFELGFGLRYDHAEKPSRDRINAVSFSVSSEEWLPRLSALYRLDDNSNVYATISRGYKTGGTNPSAAAVPTIPRTYSPEYLTNYEVGYKTVSDDRRLRFEASAYYINWTDQQLQQASGFFTFIANAGETEVMGAEALVDWAATDRLNLTFAASYNDSEYKKFVDATAVPFFFGVNPDRSGKSTFLTPDLALSASGEYKQPLTGNLDLRLRGSVRYTGERAIDTSAIFTAPALTLVNASASVGTERARIEVYADNLFDERYPTVALLFAGLPPLTYLGAPRVVGARLEVNF